MDPQSGGSIEICLSSAVKTDTVNAPNPESMADIEHNEKTDTPPSGVSTDEAFKTFEDGSSAAIADENCENEVEPMGDEEAKDGDRSDSSDIKSVEEENGGDEDVVLSSDENSGDSESNGFVSADQEPELESELVPVKNSSDIDMDDPLEIARKVAIEIKKEVEGEEEKSSSSSDGALEPINQLPETGTRVQENFSNKETQSEDTILEKTSEPVIELENLDIEPLNAATQEIEQSQVMNLLINRELSTDAEKCVCDFDLNEEIHVEMNDELDNQNSPPPPAVAAIYPFQFEGGSSLSVDCSRNRENCLGFDLNSYNPATESPKLDLNFATDDGERQNSHVINNGYHNFQSAERSLFDLNEHYGDNSNNKSVVSLMGVILEVNKKNHVSNSGPNPNPPPDAVLTQTGGFGNDSAIYTAGFSSAVSSGTYGQYGQFPYVFDSVVPAVVPGFPNQHPPMIGMTSLTGSNGVRPARFNLFDSVGASSDIPQVQHGLLNRPMFGGMSSMPGSNAVGPSSGFVFYDSIDAQIRSGLLNAHPVMGMSSMPGSNGVGPSRFHLGSNSVSPSGFNFGPTSSGPSGFSLGSNVSVPSGFSLGSNGVAPTGFNGVGPSGFNLGSNGVGATGFNLGGLNGAGSSRFNLDLNAGSFLDGNRDSNGGIREYYQQPTANLMAGMKRGELDSEREPEHYPFKHHQPNRE